MTKNLKNKILEGDDFNNINYGRAQYYLSFIQSSFAGGVPVKNEKEAKYFLERFEKELSGEYSFKYGLGETHITYRKIE